MRINKIYIFKNIFYDFPKTKGFWWQSITFQKAELKHIIYTLASNRELNLKDKQEPKTEIKTTLSWLSLPFIAGLIDGDGFLKVQKFTGEIRIVF